MSTVNSNLSHYNHLPDAGTFRFGIVVSDWNTAITDALLQGVIETLHAAGCTDPQMEVCRVPGSFELPFGAQKLAKREDIDAVICLGCVIQGETPHFTFVCDACAHGVMQVGLQTEKPVIFGVLTTLSMQQAEDRAGGKYGNKGVEAAVTALRMLAL
jgi:6,7-dimethyl-8-ribityllumazine synthase